jgi:hypothetical protein
LLQKEGNKMSEIRLMVPEEHLSSFLLYLETITYVKVEQVRIPKKRKPIAKSTKARALQTLPLKDPLRQTIKPIRRQIIQVDTTLQLENAFRIIDAGTDFTALGDPVEWQLAQRRDRELPFF